MGQPQGSDGDGLDRSELERIDTACDRFEAAARGSAARDRGGTEGGTCPGRAGLLRDLLVLELAYRRRAGERPEPDGYRARFPDDPEAVSEAFRVAAKGPPGSLAATGRPRGRRRSEPPVRHPGASRWISSPATTWSPP